MTRSDLDSENTSVEQTEVKPRAKRCRLTVLAISATLVASVGVGFWLSSQPEPFHVEDRADRSLLGSVGAAATSESDLHDRVLLEGDAPLVAGEADSADYVEFIINQGVGSVRGRAEGWSARRAIDLEFVGGKFRLPWSEIKDANRIEITAPNFVVYQWVPPEIVANPIHIQLSPAGSLVVRVYDPRGQAAPFADLWCGSTKPDQNRWDINAGFGVADETGMCVVKHIPVGPCNLMAGGFGEWDDAHKAIEIRAGRTNSAELELGFVSPTRFAILEIALSDLPHAVAPLRGVKHYFVRCDNHRTELPLFTTPDGRSAVTAIPVTDDQPRRVHVVSETTGEVSGPYDVTAGVRYRPVIKWRPTITGDVEFIINQGVGSVSGRVEIKAASGESTPPEIVGGKFVLPWDDVRDARWIKIIALDFAVYRWTSPETFSSPVHIQLLPAGSVVVRVFDARSQAVPFMRVVCNAFKMAPDERRCNVGSGTVMRGSFAVTGEKGMCVIEHIPFGPCSLGVPRRGEFERQFQRIEVIAQRVESVDLELALVSPKEFAILEVALSDLRHAKMEDRWVQRYYVRAVGDTEHQHRLYVSSDGSAAVAVIPAVDGARVEVVSQKSEEVSGPYDVIAGARYSPAISWRSLHPRTP